MKEKKEPRIVAFGGGTGLSTLLRGLKRYTPHLTAIVTVTDDGGSSGALRRELGVLPPGDIRNCLVALSEEENLMAQLFQYRFPAAGSLSGHSFGNLFITAMSALTGAFDTGIARASEVLAIRGRVLPVTLRPVTLEARLSDGSTVQGESAIGRSPSHVETLRLLPSPPPAGPKVIEAIEEAEAVIIGPGSLYTSVIANLLVAGVADTVRKARVPKIYVCNVMTQPGETANFKMSDHISAIGKHAGPGLFDHVIVNSGRIPQELVRRYAKTGSYPVIADAAAVRDVRVTKGNIVSRDGYVRHDSERLAEMIMRTLNNRT